MPFGLEQDIIDSINTVFKQFSDIERVIIYGSRAKGTYRPGSDIDLTIIGPTLTISDLITIKTLIDQLPIPYIVDLSLYHYINNPDLVEHINRVGKIFYKRGE